MSSFSFFYRKKFVDFLLPYYLSIMGMHQKVPVWNDLYLQTNEPQFFSNS